MKKYQDYTLLLEKYPYFAYAALKAIPLAPDDESKDRLRRLVAVNVGNPADLAEILSLNSDSLADFYPDDVPPKLSTFDTIDTFLSTFGQEREEAPEIPFAPEIAAVPPPAPKRRPAIHQKEEVAEESPALTESFARILIKNRNYEKALEIIQGLNLKNPEKSIYFADQIRFLKKLILNESRKKG